MLSTSFDLEFHTIPKLLENWKIIENTIPKLLENWKIIENDNSDAFLQGFSLTFNASQDTQATVLPEVLVVYPSI